MESGGIHIAEALLQARYAMFKQVYLHHVRISYDLHLQHFLQAWLPESRFPTAPDKLLEITDIDVLHAIGEASKNKSSPGFEDARAISGRRHFRSVYNLAKPDKEQYKDPVETIAQALRDRFGDENIRIRPETSDRHRVAEDAEKSDFPVSDRSGRVSSALDVSDILPNIPSVDVGVVLVHPDHAEEAASWVGENREKILKS